MSTELAITQQNTVINYDKEQIELIKKTIAIDATDLELQMFLQQCKRTGLDALTRQIYFIKNKDKVQIQTSIDGFRLIAERSEKYEGQTSPQWCGLDGVWKDVWFSNEVLPAAARVGVWKKGFREPLYAVAVFDEYAQRHLYDDKYGKFKAGDLTFMWNKMPALMISKVAESLALRKAFPNEMSGIYTQEEMAQASEPEKTHSVTQKPKIVQAPNVNAEFDPPQAGAFNQPKSSPKVDAVMDEKKKLGAEVNVERGRLGWKAAELGKFIVENFSKEAKDLSIQELKILLETMKGMKQ